jgi:16S rRNA G966 N2-methylase RsmD
LAHLLANGFRGQVKLIYIDPPFDSGADYVRKVQLRGPKGTRWRLRRREGDRHAG